MIRTAFGLAALAIFGVTSASAADLPRAMPTKAPVMAPVYNWSGFYIGGHAGHAWDPTEAVITPSALGGVGLDIQAATAPFTLRVGPEGWFGGGQIGYNWQLGTWVLGLEADASFANIKDTASGGFIIDTDDTPGVPGGDDVIITGVARLHQKIDAFGTVRGRVGYAANTLLLYVTGGLAWANVETTLALENIVQTGGGSVPAIASSYRASDRRVEWGYAVGGGAEWAFAPNWSLRGEYLFLGFPNSGSDLVLPGAAARTSGDIQMHIARVALNFRFGP